MDRECGEVLRDEDAEGQGGTATGKVAKNQQKAGIGTMVYAPPQPPYCSAHQQRLHIVAFTHLWRNTHAGISDLPLQDRLSGLEPGHMQARASMTLHSKTGLLAEPTGHMHK